MRPLAPPLALLIVLSLATTACESASTEPEGDAGPPPDTACAPVLCAPFGFRCRAGRIVRLDRVSVSVCEVATLECPEGEVVLACERGCVEGETSGRAEILCEETRPKQPGDPCASPEHCEPRAFRASALGCDVLRGVCVEIAPERCDGAIDEDADGAIDEGCECAPRLVATVPRTGRAMGVAFGADRIGLFSSDDALLGRVDVVDGEGALVASHDDLPFARRVAHAAGEMIVLLQEGSTGSSTLVQLRDDGSDARTTLERTAPGDAPWIVPDRGGWIVLTPVRGSSLGITRHAATGERLAWRQVSGISDLTFAVDHAGVALFGVAGTSFLARLESDLALLPLEPPAGTPGLLDAAVAGESLWLLGYTDEGRPLVLRRDARVGWDEPLALPDAEVLGGAARIAAELGGERLAVASYGASYQEIRVHVARVADGSRIGELTIPAPDSSAPFALGDAGSGARLVIGLADRWEIHDPCPRP